MQDGAGVGRKKSDPRIPSTQRGPSAPATLAIQNGFDQDSANIRRCFPAFLSGRGSHIEFAVTHSKRTTAPFLPGARTPQFGSRTLSRDAHCHARSAIVNALSNRELRLLEPCLTHRKQTIAPRSNRELSPNRCCRNSHAVIPILTFLPGFGLRVECAVTHSKQTTAPVLPGSRIVTTRLVSRTVFRRFSSEHFPTHRRISLQGRIARLGSVASESRMQALVGRP
jgi:hypothetical protein